MNYWIAFIAHVLGLFTFVVVGMLTFHYLTTTNWQLIREVIQLYKEKRRNEKNGKHRR